MKKGISLIELLIAMALAVFVFLLVISMLMTILTANARSSRQETFEQTKNDLQSELTNAVKWGKDISWSSGQLIVDGVAYSRISNVIIKNGQLLTPPQVKITNWTITELGQGDPNISLRMEIAMENAANSSIKDNMILTVTKRQTIIVK
ncbi:MAG: hypothetical protein UX91_C0005G0041 [Candidatus Amesbacteria bacterium GW2011_GWB1_47_19]|nr:MAG: hypothetical protein UW51_C0007G0041 [Candidatus Amesbacteria bacterium GW2011_GWA1_44_24]KKU31123.1 MAG: hypothetical protein UX46_C0007G0041 [Candidatus Amesbacteria bacterium GW2011_GWC1_46_24]KKU67244.1 MAG: hypothetical protein UX91_C0005G0041 [Candidatus Amesbacteria bacterium GW2011_GWB1_47_19]OGD05801.1 MAG: hypothetical protein A2379_01645 [Candidatus Amesbacteria bacterium RIFOXYB1_FULL_47_13]HBC72663.1 hypothetical protein [Candidatus Amesbacteria bacterium]